MKTRLEKIEIRNFKAFRKFELDLDGKHLLVYGPNGSGKSSLYWALHCFLQSARKATAQVEKYFDSSDPQNLLNIHEDATTNPGEISLTLRSMATNTDAIYRINAGTHGTLNVPVIRTGDLASDFVTYRFFFGFSHFRNSEQFDIWPLFEKEILPFCVDTGGNNPLDCWTAIKDNAANPYRDTGLAGAYSYDSYRAKVAKFTALLPAIVDSISKKAQQFYDENFAVSGEPRISLGIQLTKNATYPVGNRQANRLTSPLLELVIQIDGKTISRPQVFLNEAKLTQLALSVRLAASLVNLHTSDLKLLVLDDLLVSLDMSNRMLVVDILMSPPFQDYQKIMLTHDLGLFQEMRRRIGPSHGEWLFCKLDTDPVMGPKLSNRKTDLELAQQYLENDQLEECGNRLRKHAEMNLEAFICAARAKNGLGCLFDNGEFSKLGTKIAEAKSILEKAEASRFAKLMQDTFSDAELKLLLDPHGIDHTKIAIVDSKQKGKVVGILRAARANLEDVIVKSLTDASRKRQTALTLLADMGHIKDRILNPASHAGVTPIYTKEAVDAVKVIQQLEVALHAALVNL